MATPTQNEEEKHDIQQRPEVAMTTQGFLPRDIDQAWRYAQALAQSSFVPKQYDDKPGDCLIAIDISMRLGIHPLAFLQNSYVVNGRPGMESKLVITLINASGLFTDPLDYEVEGADPFDSNYRVRSFATRKSTGKVLYGPWITWKTVKGEGWEGKSGSKWKTIPEVMFHYRAASWFANRHCPEIKMGLDTTDELRDMATAKSVEAKVVESSDISGNEGLKQRLSAKQQDSESETGAGEAPTEVPAPSPAPESSTVKPRIKARSAEADAATDAALSEPGTAPSAEEEDPEVNCPNAKCGCAFALSECKTSKSRDGEIVAYWCPECAKNGRETEIIVPDCLAKKE